MLRISPSVKGEWIAPTAASRTQVDRPIALVDAVNTISPATYTVHVDHLNRPIKVTSTTKASVWTAVWKPWGEVHAITGTPALESRFPGQSGPLALLWKTAVLPQSYRALGPWFEPLHRRPASLAGAWIAR